MAKEDLVPMNKRTKEEQKRIATMGGIASGKTRQKKASFKNAIKWLAESNINITEGKLYEMYKENGVDISKLSPTELATIGLWFGAVTGKNENYKTLMEGNEELKHVENTETPDIKIKVIDTSSREKALWEDEEDEEN